MLSHRGTSWLFYACVALFVSGCSGCWTNWRETFRYDYKQPYDTYGLYELLKARPEGSKLVEDSLAMLDESEGNYVFVGSYAYYNERSVTNLLNFVERGNTAFIAAYELPEDLAGHLFGDDCYYSFYDDEERFLFEMRDTVSLRLENNGRNYELYNIYEYEPSPRATRYLNYGLLCDSLYDNEILGTMNGTDVNFVRLRWGEGNFYFHVNPVFFTNYYLVDSVQYAYPEDALAVLGGGPVYWDEASRVPPTVARRRGNRQSSNYSGGRNLLSGNEALSYIQEQPPLALAWYTLLAAVLLYVVFRGKRRQRIIPVIKPRENSSKRFIGTMSRLVRQKGRHIMLARQEVGSLRFHLQDRYGIRWREGEPPPDDLAEQLGVPQETISRAITEIRIVQKRDVLEEHELIRFYRAVEPLYGKIARER